MYFFAGLEHRSDYRSNLNQNKHRSHEVVSLVDDAAYGAGWACGIPLSFFRNLGRRISYGEFSGIAEISDGTAVINQKSGIQLRRPLPSAEIPDKNVFSVTSTYSGGNIFSDTYFIRSDGTYEVRSRKIRSS